MNEIESLGLTKQRQAVLSVIRESEKHLTANEVFDDARALLPGISFATVYNSLHFLKNHGLIGEISFGNGSARYDRKLTRHDHAVCSECGSLVDIDVAIPGEVVEQAARLSRFRADSIELVLRGRCPDCA